MEKQFLLRIPIDLHKQLKVKAAEQGITLHQLIISTLNDLTKGDG